MVPGFNDAHNHFGAMNVDYVELRNTYDPMIIRQKVAEAVERAKPGEMITAVRIPVLAPSTGWAFKEFARRRGDYALAGICALMTLGDGGRCTSARLAACGIASTALRLVKAEQELSGGILDEAAIARAARAARDAVTAADDSQASTAYRRHLVDTLTRRTLALANGRALERRAS
ncbi:MAG: hypothetical protein QF767_13560, partial [Alphaproteobacteria bacterium]|nr:hypothetical protein [Alphaproteobacteria bacterium]